MKFKVGDQVMIEFEEGAIESDPLLDRRVAIIIDVFEDTTSYEVRVPSLRRRGLEYSYGVPECFLVKLEGDGNDK